LARERQLTTSTVSTRLLWPFIRTVGAEPRILAGYAREGLSPADFIQPDGRLPHSTLARLLRDAVEITGDPQIGLKAGLNIQRGDMDVLEYAASTCLTLRGALDCFVRFKSLLHDGVEITLVEDGDVATWRYRVTDGVDMPPAEMDFVAALTASFVISHTGRDDPALAVHFAHQDRTNLEEYKRIFRCPIEFGQPHTGFVFRSERLGWPLTGANPALRSAFESQLHDKFSNLRRGHPTSSAVRNALLSHMASGDVSMASVARKLGMSTATLRRRLAEEETTHSQLLEETRRELAFSYLKRHELAVNEVAFLLRFSDPAAFHRAFKRWTGTTPQAFRKQG
jgi:AraC-like DNA-binding protein